mgnify:CR=1 FL=1
MVNAKALEEVGEFRKSKFHKGSSMLCSFPFTLFVGFAVKVTDADEKFYENFTFVSQESALSLSSMQ